MRVIFLKDGSKPLAELYNVLFISDIKEAFGGGYSFISDMKFINDFFSGIPATSEILHHIIGFSNENDRVIIHLRSGFIILENVLKVFNKKFMLVRKDLGCDGYMLNALYHRFIKSYKCSEAYYSALHKVIAEVDRIFATDSETQSNRRVVSRLLQMRACRVRK